MPHYSEMDFLFSPTNSQHINKLLDNNSQDNTYNVFTGDNVSRRITYKGKTGTSDIKNYLKDQIYSDDNKNPYRKLIDVFSDTTGTPGAGLRIKAADLVYLRDLGVYPINRMVILRRFNDGMFLDEDLSTIKYEPISTIIGWIKPDKNFGNISFNETWTKTNKRFDTLLADIIRKNFKIPISDIIPIPDFAQGILFELYRKQGLTGGDQDSNWGLSEIPVGDPNVLKEGPFRDPEGQNIQSNFQFELETTYEQKILGDVDPGSAMLDILDNIYAMGTSNMKYYWSENSTAIAKARKAASDEGNDITTWWLFVNEIMTNFWTTITDLFDQALEAFSEMKAKYDKKVESATKEKIMGAYYGISPEKGSGKEDPTNKVLKDAVAPLSFLLQSILASTISIHRYNIRGSIELMTGGRLSSTPWYITLGNPYTPWLATNHIIVKSASIETSTELGFNDQPQWLNVKFNCEFSRALGKQELMRMFNNSFERKYTVAQTRNKEMFGNIEGPSYLNIPSMSKGTKIDTTLAPMKEKVTNVKDKADKGKSKLKKWLGGLG